jgi:hypothetical protein
MTALLGVEDVMNEIGADESCAAGHEVGGHGA